MAHVAVCGGSVAGLATALLLARRGHDIVVLERDPLDPHESLAQAESRPLRAGAPHAVQGHAYLSTAYRVLKEELPDVLDAMVSAGVRKIRRTDHMPLTIEDRSPMPGDEDLIVLGSRRSTLEWVLRQAAVAERRIELRTGVTVTGLLATDGTDPPRIRGVQLGSDTMHAHVTVDASGRQSKIAQWLAAIGAAPPPLESAECGVLYYTRHARLRQDAPRPPLPNGISSIIGYQTFAAVLFLADNDTIMYGLAVFSEDPDLKAVRSAPAFEAAARLVPWLAPWLDCSEPITDVFAMGSVPNTLRRMVASGRPLAVGLHLVGDTTCTTNPTFGRGVSLALHQVQALARVLDQHPDDLKAQALVMDADVEAHIQPWFDDQAMADAARLAQIRRAFTGTAAAQRPDETPDKSAITFQQVVSASAFDPVVWRAVVRRGMLLDLPDAWRRNEDVLERVRRMVEVGLRPAPLIEPPREEIVAAVRGAGSPPTQA